MYVCDMMNFWYACCVVFSCIFFLILLMVFVFFSFRMFALGVCVYLCALLFFFLTFFFVCLFYIWLCIHNITYYSRFPMYSIYPLFASCVSFRAFNSFSDIFCDFFWWGTMKKASWLFFFNYYWKGTSVRLML